MIGTNYPNVILDILMSPECVSHVVSQILHQKLTRDTNDVRSFQVKSFSSFSDLEKWEEGFVLSTGGDMVSIRVDRSILFEFEAIHFVLTLPDLLNKVGYPALLEEEYRIQSL